jgi:hypothetical protein
MVAENAAESKVVKINLSNSRGLNFLYGQFFGGGRIHRKEIFIW